MALLSCLGSLHGQLLELIGNRTYHRLMFEIMVRQVSGPIDCWVATTNRDIWKALPGGIDCGGYQDTFHCFQLLVGRWVKVRYWPAIKVISDSIATNYMSLREL